VVAFKVLPLGSYELMQLHNEELHNLFSSPNTIRTIKSRRVRRVGYIARMGEMKNAYRSLVGKAEGSKPLGRSDGSLKMDHKYVVVLWTGLIWLRIETSGGLL
jgi:hypothetical protein